MKSLFQHKENFVDSLENIEHKEVEKNVFKDTKGNIYTWAFGKEKFVKYENFESYINLKGKVIYFSINSLNSSFILLDKQGIGEVLCTHEIKSTAKVFNEIETAYFLDNEEIIMYDDNETYGWLFKNIQEMNLILSDEPITVAIGVKV